MLAPDVKRGSARLCTSFPRPVPLEQPLGHPHEGWHFLAARSPAAGLGRTPAAGEWVSWGGMPRTPQNWGTTEKGTVFQYPCWKIRVGFES